MRYKLFILTLITLGFISEAFSQNDLPPFPETKKTPVTDDYWGTKITDNYRWLENMDNSEVQIWFKSQGEYFDNIINRIPGRDLLYNEFLKLDSLRTLTISRIVRSKDRYFYLKGLAGENVLKLAYRDGLIGNETILFNPAAFEKGKVYTISYLVPSRDGKKIAFGISESGSEQARILIMDVDTKQLYPESIFPSWFGVSDWTDDNSAFIYTSQKSSDLASKDLLLNTKVKMHKPGTDPSTDPIIFSKDKYPGLGIVPEDLLFLGFGEDRKFIIASLGGVQNEQVCFFAPASELTAKQINWKPLFKKSDSVTGFIYANDSIYFLTHKNASNSKIMVTSESKPDPSNARVVLPEGKEEINNISRSQNYLFAVLTDGINQHVLKYKFQDGSFSDVPSPETGVVDIDTYDIYDDNCILSVSGWKTPYTRYDYDASTDRTTIGTFNTAITYPGMEDLVAKEVEAKSYDGVMVPLSILMNKNTKLDGNNICYLEGYGAYGISTTPFFSFINLALTQKGIIIAYAHVRGGGEKGNDWHMAGYKQTKPNTWKDFIACAEYLINEGYSSNTKLIGEGTSAGGILIGRAITERPDLFGAAVCNVGAANALRFEVTPNGPNNTREFGTVKDKDECNALIEMDAFLHVKEGVKYPAVFCNTGINDPRVAPWEPGKFAAILQNSTASGKPVVLRVDYNSGHFSREKIVTFKYLADMLAFVLWQTGHTDFQMK
jgi:prolyl oligopeptidase